jgi:mRNA interferase HigB
MRLLNKKLLLKFKGKSRGNRRLNREIDSLIDAIEIGTWKNQLQLKRIRPDADCVHADGFYFFNISILRAMILIEFEDNEASMVRVGTHEEYQRVFKNNKRTIQNWLRTNEWIK